MSGHGPTVATVETGSGEGDAASWYLRSLGDHDTHRGRYAIGTRRVRSVCGVEFVPRELLLSGPALPGNPQDPDQVCPRCRAVKVSR